MEKAFIVSCGKARFMEDLFPSYYKTHGYRPGKMKIQREDGVYIIAEQLPEYPGGMIKMIEFIKKNYKLRGLYAKEKVFATVDVVIDTNGSIKSAVVSKSHDETVDREVLRVVSLMPRWKAAIHKGKNVPCLYTIPFPAKWCNFY